MKSLQAYESLGKTLGEMLGQQDDGGGGLGRLWRVDVSFPYPLLQLQRSTVRGGA